MHCPYCGSDDIVYEYEYGYIVCSSCGTVLDIIFIEYYDNYPRVQYEEVSIGLPSVRKGIEKKKLHPKRATLSKMNFEVMVYEKYVKKARRNVYVDIDAALKKELKINTVARVYHHKGEEKVLKLIENDSKIRFIIENIIDKDPILSSRTPRGKVALALIIKNLVEGRPLDLDKVCELTSMSMVHIKRLINLIKRRAPYISTYFKNIASNLITN